MSKQKNHVEMLTRLTDALVEDILNASDEDILKEAVEDYGDPNGEAAKVRALYEKTQVMMSKKRLLMAKSAVDQEKCLRRNIPHINPNEARGKLEAILRENPEASREFTLAARKGQELSDSDVVGMLEDLQELGLYHPEDDQDET